MKTTATGFVFMELEYQRGDNGVPLWAEPKVWLPQLWSCRVEDRDTRVFVGAQEVTVEIPDDFDPTAKQIAAIEREKLAALQAYQRAVADCNERLSKLQALEAA